MRAGEERCEEDAPQEAYQAPHAGGSGLMPAFSGGQMPGWQGSEQWMHPGAALPGWEVAAGWNAGSSAGYAMPYTMPPPQLLQQPQLQPQLQTRGGVIFLCDPQTEDECLQRGLFGMPASQTQIVRQIAPEATLLFLFNVRRPPRSPAARRARASRRSQPPSLCLCAAPPGAK